MMSCAGGRHRTGHGWGLRPKSDSKSEWPDSSTNPVTRHQSNVTISIVEVSSEDRLACACTTLKDIDAGF